MSLQQLQRRTAGRYCSDDRHHHDIDGGRGFQYLCSMHGIRSYLPTCTYILQKGLTRMRYMRYLRRRYIGGSSQCLVKHGHRRTACSKKAIGFQGPNSALCFDPNPNASTVMNLIGHTDSRQTPLNLAEQDVFGGRRHRDASHPSRTQHRQRR
jgi:hypothetical protein